jgi:hypothetical protein
MSLPNFGYETFFKTMDKFTCLYIMLLFKQLKPHEVNKFSLLNVDNKFLAFVITSYKCVDHNVITPPTCVVIRPYLSYVLITITNIK